MTAAQILWMNHGRRPIADDGPVVSDLEAARWRHLRGEAQPNREAPAPTVEPEANWADADVEPDTLEVDFA